MNGPSLHLRMALCHPTRRHKGRGFCRSCLAIAHRKELAADPRKRRSLLAREKVWKDAYRNRNLPLIRLKRTAKRYGLTLTQLEELLARGCAICRTTTRLTVDHDHRTGKVRGCLCQRHNNLVGYLDSARDHDLAKALDYLGLADMRWRETA